MSGRMHWERLAAAILLLGIGVFGGLRLAPRADPSADDAQTGHGGDHENEAALSNLEIAQLERLGVEVARMALTSFVATKPVPAVVEALPTNHRMVHTPIGGRVTRVHVAIGQRVDVGDPIVTLLRAPLPRPSLTITSDLLAPAQERVHEVVLALRSRALEVRIAEEEIERVKELRERAPENLQVVSPQRLVDLEYELRRAKSAARGAREEAERHGLSEEQIRAVIEGEHGPMFDSRTWRAALVRNGLWPDAADELWNSLPASLRETPWVVGTVGELVASGLADDGLVEWLKSDASAARHFLDIGVLLQRGHSIEELGAMHARGAFEAVVTVRAPERDGAASYDMDELLVQEGAVVEGGDALASLHDPRRMRLAVHGVGSERALLVTSLEAGTLLRATPLVAGVGPELEGVEISYLRGGDEPHRSGGVVDTGDTTDTGSVAVALVANEVLSETGPESGSRYRTWALRPGLRYVVHVPFETRNDVFVLPSDAVFPEAGEPAVLVKEREEFHVHPVALVHRDENYAVVAPGPGVELFSGDRVVTRGAAEVLRVLRADTTGGADAHHGHSH